MRTALQADARHGLTTDVVARYSQQGGLFAFDAPAVGLPRPRFAS